MPGIKTLKWLPPVQAVIKGSVKNVSANRSKTMFSVTVAGLNINSPAIWRNLRNRENNRS